MSPPRRRSEEIFALPNVRSYEQLRKDTNLWPTRLFHYTSAQGLHGIISGTELWATDVRFLNDAREFDHGLDLARAVVEGVVLTDIEEQLRSEIRNFLALPSRSDLGLGSERWAVFALSEEGDLLSQWRAYCPADGGYALGFDPLRLRQTGAHFVFGLCPCLYDETTQRDILEGYVYRQMEEFTRHYGTGLGVAEHHRTQLWYNILRSCVLFKHSGFREEAEWRLMGIPEHLPMPWSYRPDTRMLIPYAPLHIPFEAERHPLVEVIIGPTAKPSLAEASLRGFLNINDLPQVTIRHSLVPVRTL